MQNPGRFMVRFTRRQLREDLGWGDTQLKVHLARLVDLELVSAHRVEHGIFLYELAWDGSAGRDGGRFMVGVSDPSQPSLPLAEMVEDPKIHGYDLSRSGPEAVWSGAGRGLVGGRSAGGRTTQNIPQPNTSMASQASFGVTDRNSTDTPNTTDSVIDQTPLLSAVGGL